MKKPLLFVTTLLIAITAYGFNETITYLKGRADVDAILIEWQSGSEEGIQSYTIERSEIRNNDFQSIGTITATGSNSSYKYRDAAINSMIPVDGTGGTSKVPLADLYKYRLKINYENNVVSYSQTISVTRPSSAVKRTWGMIKEMFR